MRSIHRKLLVMALWAAAAPQAALGFCENAEPYNHCINAEGFDQTPDWTLALTFPRKPPLLTPPALTTGSVNLLEVLPVNDAISLVYNTIPENLIDCHVPVMRHQKVLSFATRNSSRYYKTFEACTNAPVPAYRIPEYSSFVYGAFGDLSRIPSRQLNKLPQLKRFVRSYSGLGRHLGVCIATNPCQQNMYVGFKRMTRHLTHEIKWGEWFSRVNMRVEALIYSAWVQGSPPAWQNAAGETKSVAAWHIKDPLDFYDLGVMRPVTQSAGTTVKGTEYVEGPLKSAWGQNVVILRTLKFDLGPQKRAWVFVRDSVHVALSMGMTTVPDITLWNRLSLPFRTVEHSVPSLAFKDVQLTLRSADCQFWLTAPPGQNLPAHLLAYHMPSIGKVLKQLFPDITEPSQKLLTAMHIHGDGVVGPVAGSTSVAVRLELGSVAGNETWRLSSRAAVAFNRKVLTGNFAVILTAERNASSFINGATLEYLGTDGLPLSESQRVLRTCRVHADCPQGEYYDTRGGFHFFYDCNERARVCFSKRVPLGAATAGAASIQSSEPTTEPALSPGPDPWAGTGWEAAVGQPCKAQGLGSTCPLPLVCHLDPASARSSCQQIA